MVTDQQVRRLMKLSQTEKTLSLAAAKGGMDEKTARKYLRLGKLPSELKVEHNWRTRPDPFSEVWEEVSCLLSFNTGLEAKTLFQELQRQFPGRFQDGQLRTLQRRVKTWRALEGPAKEVFFAQEYHPGELCSSDFTSMNELNVTIQSQRFDHLVYHFVLPYSNWEAGTICFSESFESLSEGFQNGLWKLGGVPKGHRTDRLTAAVHKDIHPENFTRRYRGLLDHYGMEGHRTNADSPHENGDVEQRHHRFKVAVDQALMLRGSRDFEDRKAYNVFLEKLYDQLNAGRQDRLAEELVLLRRLPQRRLESYKSVEVRVSQGSTIRVNHNVYSVESRLIGEKVRVRLYAEEIQVWYAQRQIDTFARLRGVGKHRIQYRHIIDWLVRKPGAFENYRYRDDLYPTIHFRIAYDQLQQAFAPARANKEYLRILQYAALLSEVAVESALSHLIFEGELATLETVEHVLFSELEPELTEVHIDPVDLSSYDCLLEPDEVVSC
ncbi:hypothetical protein LCGC14_1073240 [marine sediment metagenome]|uniref:Integrase catalytic domain-containing protein n=1 Tax=marine sediment metagenome TaxID=412755 RepID=A0A0F9MMI1_9ZZZZ